MADVHADRMGIDDNEVLITIGGNSCHVPIAMIPNFGALQAWYKRHYPAYRQIVASDQGALIGLLIALGIPWTVPSTGTGPDMADNIRFASPTFGFDCYYIAGLAGDGSALTTGLITLNALIGIPFSTSKTLSVDRLVFNTTVVGGAGAKGRAGIYASDSITGYPTTLVVDAGEFDLSSVGGIGSKNATISASLTPGLYWFAYLCGTTSATLYTIANTSGTGASGVLQSLGWRSTFAAQQLALSVFQAYGALPATFPAGAVDTTNAGANTNTPAIGVRIASIS